MSNLTQNLVNPNAQPLVIGDFSIRQDEDGRYCLNDLHKASGGLEKHKPTRFIRNKQTQELVSEIESEDNQRPNLVSYAMWISAKFHLIVIRAYRAQVAKLFSKKSDQSQVESKTTKKERVPLKDAVNMLVGKAKFLNYSDAYKLVHQRFNVEHIEDIPQEQIPSAVEYVHCLLGEYIPREEVKEQKVLPYPTEVVRVAQQINYEFNGGQYDSWFVNARDGVLSVIPLPHGYYPFNVKEFTKHFDGVLNTLYGSDVLQMGRYMQRQG
jgi:KilA-N domain